MSSEVIEALVDDAEFVWGARNIGRTIGVPTRKAFYLLEHDLLPARKVGGVWVAARAKLRAALGGE
jgi:hypothetical protein